MKLKIVLCLWACFIFLCLPARVFSQGLSVSGKVSSKTNIEGLSGATISLKGSSLATTTDASGNYRLDLPAPGILVITFSGMAAMEKTVTSSGIVNFELETMVGNLDEVVVVGYGTQKKSDLSGSVARINVDRATAIPSTNVSEMLRGQAAGVQVTLGSARPGGGSSILIRGRNSITGSNDPIYVIDGVPVPNINDINADGITSIEVLKDAAAQAIYGSRGANGVVLITTKRGRQGKMKVNYDMYSTVQKLTRNFDLYSPLEFAQLRREAQRTTANLPNGAYLPDANIFTDFELKSLANNQFADWDQLILGPARVQNHTVSVGGGTENTKLYTSVSLFNQKGIIPGSGYKRGTFRMNLDQKISDRLSMQANINLLSAKQSFESTGLDVIQLSPLARPFDSLGNINKYPLGPTSLTINPLWNNRESVNEAKTNTYNLNIVLDYRILKGLSYKVNSLISRITTDEGSYITRLHGSGVIPQGRASVTNSLREEYLLENILNYDLNINKNNHVDFTAVGSVQSVDYSTTTLVGTTFPNDLLGYDGIADALNKTATRGENRRRIASGLGRIRYNLYDRYLFTVTGRYDGASVFAQKNKWAFFPAAAFAWKIQNESFMNNVRWVNELKFRASYGSVGNQAISPYQTLGVVGSNPYVFGGVVTGGNIPGNVLPNPFLTWETASTFNAGFDFGLFQNRLTGSIEYYDKRTKDLLVDISLAGNTGFSSQITNGGQSQNSGIELLLNAQIIRSKDFNWSVTSTFANNRNKILKTGLLDINGKPKDDVGRNRYIGQPINIIRQQRFDGIFQSVEEIQKSAQATQAGILPGDIRVVDTNGDGKITDADNILIKPDPKFFGSIATTLSYKRFELFADLYIVEGAHKYNPYLADYATGGSLQGILNGIKVPYYTPENPSTSYPRPRSVTGSYLSSLAVQDASYIRLRTLSLSYSVPPQILEKVHISNFRFYVMSNNLFTSTKYKSYSPEVNPDAFPDTRSFTFGVNVGF